MRSLLILIALTAVARADSPIVMYEIHVAGSTVQDIKEGAPTGKPRAVKMTSEGSSSCHFATPPKGTYHPWFDGEIDDSGRFRPDPDQHGGAPDEVSYCAKGVLINASFTAPAGSYRVTSTVAFKTIQYREPAMPAPPGM